PVVRVSDVAFGVVLVKFGMLHQHAVPRRVIRNDVDDDFHAARVRLANEALQIVGGTVIRIDDVVVAHGVRAANRSLFLFLTNTMNGHQPENWHAEIFEVVETGRDGVEVSWLRKGAWVDLVDNAVANPIRYRAR